MRSEFVISTSLVPYLKSRSQPTPRLVSVADVAMRDVGASESQINKTFGSVRELTRIAEKEIS